MEEALQPVVLDGLERVDAEVHLREERQIFNELQLVDLLDVIQIKVEELQALYRLETAELANLVL